MRRFLAPLLLAGVAMGQDPRTAFPVPDGPVHALARHGDTLYLGGDFSRLGPATGHGVVVDAVSGAREARSPAIDGAVLASVPDGAGGWFVGGRFTRAGGLARNGLAHLLPDGTVDPAWDPDVRGGEVRALVVQGELVYAGGTFALVNGTLPYPRLARFRATGGGAADRTFRPAPDGTVFALAASGPWLYAGGGFTAVSGGLRRTHLARFPLAGDGSADPDFALAPDGWVRALLVSGRYLYVGGGFATVSKKPAGDLARIDLVSGALDEEFRPALTEGFVYALAAEEDASAVWAGGSFALASDRSRGHLLRFDARQGGRPDGARVTGTGGRGEAVYTLAVSDGVLYAGGSFRDGGDGEDSFALAVRSGNGAPVAFRPAPDGPVFSLAVDSGRLFLGGDLASVNGLSRRNLAAVDLRSGEITPFDPAPGGPVHALLVHGDRLFAGGEFEAVNRGTLSRPGLAAFLVNGGGRADEEWAPVAGPGSVVRSLATDGRWLYAGGTLLGPGGLPGWRYLARFEASGTGSFDASWDPAPDGPVRALLSAPPWLYAGGDFGICGTGGPARTRLARIATEGPGASDAAFAPSFSGGRWGSPSVRSLATDGLRLLVGGNFTTAGSAGRTYAAAFRLHGPGEPDAFAPDLDEWVHAISVDGSRVLLGGRFGPGEGHGAALASAEPKGGADQEPPAPALGPAPTVNALLPTEAGLVVGGDFATVGGDPRPNLLVVAEERKRVDALGSDTPPARR